MFDIGNDSHFRPQAQEHEVIFICFDDKVWPVTIAAVATHLRQHATDDHGRVEIGFYQDVGDHPCGCCLAMRTGHGDANGAGHEFANQVGALDDRNALCTSRDDLRVVGRNGRRHRPQDQPR